MEEKFSIRQVLPVIHIDRITKPKAGGDVWGRTAENSSISKMLASQACLSWIPQSPYRNLQYKQTNPSLILGIFTLEQQGQVDPWGSLVRQLGRFDDFKASERLFH